MECGYVGSLKIDARSSPLMMLKCHKHQLWPNLFILASSWGGSLISCKGITVNSISLRPSTLLEISEREWSLPYCELKQLIRPPTKSLVTECLGTRAQMRADLISLHLQFVNHYLKFALLLQFIYLLIYFYFYEF